MSSCYRCGGTDFLKEGFEVYCSNCFCHVHRIAKSEIINSGQFRESVNYIPDDEIIPDLVAQTRARKQRYFDKERAKKDAEEDNIIEKMVA